MNRMEIETYRAAFREMICNEELLIHRRLTWLLAVQAFLFTGLFNTVSTARYSWVVLMAVAGASISMLILSALLASVTVFGNINAGWLKIRPQEYEGPDIFGMAPPFVEGKFVPEPYMSSENAVAFILWIFWFVIFILYFLKAHMCFLWSCLSVAAMVVNFVGVCWFWFMQTKFPKRS